MSRLISRAPRPPLSEHPAFALMLLATLERFRCTMGEVREDYWLNRAWRALSGDPELAGRVARFGMGSAMVTGGDFAAASTDRAERARWRLRVLERLQVDTGHAPDQLGMALVFAEDPIGVAPGRMHSLLAQAIEGDPRFDGLGAYADDLAPVIVPVASSVRATAVA